MSPKPRTRTYNEQYVSCVVERKRLRVMMHEHKKGGNTVKRKNYSYGKYCVRSLFIRAETHALLCVFLKWLNINSVRPLHWPKLDGTPSNGQNARFRYRSRWTRIGIVRRVAWKEMVVFRQR